MKTKDEIIAILRNFKEEFGERYGIEKLGLFGSVARGEQKEDSDIDICVKLQDPDYFTRMEIKESLEERFTFHHWKYGGRHNRLPPSAPGS